jgi:hypothetical protein
MGDRNSGIYIVMPASKLFDIYPLHKSNDFATKIDEMIRVMGRQRFNETANFLKHADRDTAELLRYHDADGTQTFIGLASLMYRRIAGDFTPLMCGFVCWTEALSPEAFDISPVAGFAAGLLPRSEMHHCGCNSNF